MLDLLQRAANYIERGEQKSGRMGIDLCEPQKPVLANAEAQPNCCEVRPFSAQEAVEACTPLI